jgi:hypothetical protein
MKDVQKDFIDTFCSMNLALHKFEVFREEVKEKKMVTANKDQILKAAYRQWFTSPVQSRYYLFYREAVKRGLCLPDGLVSLVFLHLFFRSTSFRNRYGCSLLILFSIFSFFFILIVIKLNLSLPFSYRSFALVHSFAFFLNPFLCLNF